MHNFFQILILSMLISWRSIYRGNSDNSEKKDTFKFWINMGTDRHAICHYGYRGGNSTDSHWPQFFWIARKKIPIPKCQKINCKEFEFLILVTGSKGWVWGVSGNEPGFGSSVSCWLQKRQKRAARLNGNEVEVVPECSD